MSSKPVVYLPMNSDDKTIMYWMGLGFNIVFVQ